MRTPRPSVVLLVAVLAVAASIGLANVRSHRPVATVRGIAAGNTTPGSGSAVAGAGPVIRPLDNAVLVCPAAPAFAGMTTSTITAAAPPGGSGTLTVSSFGPRAGPPVARATSTASLVRYSVSPATSGVFVVRATGARARGLTASVVTRTSQGGARGLSTVACTAPAGESWLIGGGASVGRLSRIYLSNVDPTPATVNLTLYTAKGAVQPAPAQGLQVPPFGQIAVAVDSLVPGQGPVAVEVAATSGRVAAAMLDSQQTGLAAQGVDWVTPSAPPSNQAVVVGVPGVAAAGLPADSRINRTLSLVVPGSVDANVAVRLVTKAGTLSPPALATLSVPAGRLYSIDLRAYATSAPFGVVVSSDQPVLASVRTVQGPPGQTQDFSYATGTAAVLGSVVLPYALSPTDYGTALQLVNPGQHDLTVTIGFTPPMAHEADLRVTVPAGQLVQLRVGTTTGLPSSLLISGPSAATSLYVGWVLSEQGAHGPLVTGGSVPQTPLVQTAPPVLSDPAVGYPGH
jgi:hypothetical protein